MRTHWLTGAVCAALLVLCLGLPISCYGPSVALAQPSPPSEKKGAGQNKSKRQAQAARQASDGPIEVPAAAPAPETPTPTPPAPPPAEAPPALNALNFKDADLGIVLKWISDKEGKPILRTEGLDKKITLINPKQLSDADNLALIYKMLSSLGIAIVDDGDLLLVMSTKDLKTSNVRNVKGGEIEQGKEVPISYSRQLKFAKAKDLAERLKPMVRDPEAIAYDEATNTLVLTDTTSYVKRFAELLDLVDKEPYEEVKTTARPIKNASATELLEPCRRFIEKFAKLRGDLPPTISIQAEPSLNTLIIRGSARELEAITAVIDRLDGPAASPSTLTIRRRPVDHTSPDDLMAQARDFLVRHVEISELLGGISRTTFSYEPTTRELIMRGPASELDALASFLNEIDKPLTSRNRKINYADPETLVEDALTVMLKNYAEEGRPNYKHTISWRKDRFDPSTLVFRGPAVELDRLFLILDQFDKPTTTQSRKFNNRKPEEVFPEALDLLVDQYLHDGKPNYKPAITWRRDPLNPANIIIRGPNEELARFMPIIEQLDKTTTQRPRQIFSATPELVIPAAIERLIKQFAEEGQADYKPSIKWKRDEFNRSVLVFTGPAPELDRLFLILDQLDKPAVVQQRRFYSKTPEEILPKAFELLVRRYAEEGRPGYKHSITWKRDLLNPAMVNLKGPQEELSRLTAILDQLDKTTTERMRQFYNATPEEAVPAAIERMIKRFAEEGQAGYEPSITWERDEFNPTNIRFKGPAIELDRLFLILDQLDRPMVISNRAITNGTAENLIAPAQRRLKQYFVDNNRPKYEPVTTFRVDPLNGNLVMRGPQEEITALTAILSDLDQPRMQNLSVTTQEFPLGFAEAADLISAASEYLAHRVALEGKRGDKPGVTFMVNPLTRSISLRGPTAQLTYVVQVMTAIEQNTKRGRKPMVIYPKHTTATQLYTELSQFITGGYAAQSAPLLIQLTRLDALIVSGRPEDLARVREWADMLDREGSEDKVVKSIPVENAVPSTLVSGLRVLFPSTGGVLYPDDAASRILIRDSTQTIQRITSIVKELDQPMETKDLVVEIYRAQSANVGYLYSILSTYSQQLATKKKTSRKAALVQLEPNTSSIILLGSKDEVQGLLELAKKLDKVTFAETKPKFIPLDNLSAGPLTSRLSSMLQGLTSKQTPPLIVPDPRLNMLIVAGTPADVSKVTEIVKTLDVPGNGNLVSKIVKLENAEASSFTQTLTPLLSEAGKMYAEPRTNSILILDSTQSINRLMPFIKELDQPMEIKDLVVEIYKSQSANVSYLYTTLSTYSQQLAIKKKSSRKAAMVQYDPYTATIILLGSKDEVQGLLELAKKLDTVTFAESKPKFIPLNNLSAPLLTSRMTTMLQGLTSKQTPPLIVGDPRLNMLIVAGTPADVSRVAEIVKTLDVPGNGNLVSKVVKLENAEASSFTQTLTPLLSEAGKMYAEPRTNSILILDSTQSINRLMPFIKELDQPMEIKDLVVEIYKSQSANVSYLYTTLSTYSQQLAIKKKSSRKAAMVQYDPYTATIILLGSKDEVQGLLELAKKLDTVTFAETKPKFIPLNNLNASLLTTRISAMLQGITSKQTPPLIASDPRLNMLIVAGTPADVSRVAEIVKTLDVPGNGNLVSKVVKLENAEAGPLTTTLTPLLSEAGKMYADARTNSILILDSTQSINRLMPFIKQFDSGESRESFVVKVIQVKTANTNAIFNPLNTYVQQLSTSKGSSQRSRPQVMVDASTQSIIVIGREADVKDILRIAEELDKLQWQGQEPEFIHVNNAIPSTVAVSVKALLPSITKGGVSVQVIPDDRTSTLIVIAQPSDIALVKGIIEKLDVKDAGDLITKIIPIKSSMASSIYSAIYTLISKRGSLSQDANSNSIILRDTAASVEFIEKIIQDLDTSEAAAAWVTEVRTLRQIDPTTVATMLTNIGTQLSFKKGRTRPQSYAYPEPSSSSVILIGASEEVKADLEMIDRLEAAGQVGGKVRLFFLKYTKAKALQSQLTQVFTSVRRTAGVQPTVVISDDFTNSLIAIGSELDLSRLDELVAKLDIPNAAGLEVEIFPLVGVSASILASNLQLALSGPKGTLFADTNSNSLVVVDTPDAISRISKVIKELGQRGGGITAKVHKLEHGLASNLFAPINSYLTTQATRAGRPTQVVLFQEPAANALVILGPTNEVRSLQALIRTLDTEEMAALEPKVFPLKYVRATALQPQFALLYPQTTLTGIRPIVVAEDTTNTLIVVAPDADLKRIEGIINQIDSADATGLETRVYQIKYSSAERMATNFRPPLISARGRAFAAGGTNTLVIIDTPEVQERLKEFIDRIDLGRGQVVSEVRRLENTSVATLATPLQQFLTHQAQTKGLTQALTQIISDQTSNSVIIYGPSDEVELAKHLIDQLDAESLFEREVKIFPLKRAQAQATVSTLTQLLSIDRKGTGTNAPRVVAEPESNSLIVIASKADLARAEELLKTLDQTDITGVETRVFRLKNADPKVLATNLKPMVGNPAKLLPDAVSNSIFYTDTTANLDRLGKLITQLDTVGGNTGIKTVVQPLRNTTAASVDFALSDFARYFSEKKERRDRPLTRVTADAATNSVLIIGPSDEVDQMMAILKELDRDNLREREPKIYFLKQAQAQALGGQLSLLMASLTQGPAGGSPNAPRIIPNPESNSLLVLATPADRAIIDGLILALDSEDGGFRKPKVLRLRNADATALVASLRPTIGPIASIAAHPDSNSVIYADTPANVEKLFALIEQLDRESRPEDIASEIVTLENSKAGAITEPLQKIITQLSTSRQRKNKVPLQAFADPDANAVVIVGASEEVSQIGKIVRELDSESLSERKPEIFILEYARSADLATELDKLFLQTARFGTAPKIVADKWANALLVIADPRDMDWIRRLIKELDTREGRKRVVQIFVLENADASILAQRLQNLLVPGSDTSGGRRNPYDYYGYYGGSGRRSETLTEGQVSIIADQRLNALVVTAEPQDMSQVSELIDALDIESPNIEEPRVYHIQHGEAETLAETLQNLFTDTDYQRGNYYGAAREVNVSSLSGKVRVSADPVTNSIIVMASSPRAFDVVEEMLKKLDQPSVQAGQTSIIPVRNALAKDLQKLLSALFKQEDTTRTQGQRRGFFFDPFFGSSSGGGGGAGSFSNLVGKVKIEADTRTNSLLVITPELYRASVERLVASLDTPTNQVLLEVLIVEVALGNEEDKGIQWGVDPTTGDVGRISVSNDEILTFDNDRSDLFNPNTFGNTLFNSAAENLQFFSLNRAKFDAVINFLETCRNVNVQSRPNILTADNRKAKIFVGKDFPYVKSISTSGNFVNTSIEYKKLGLDLTVTPHINSATTVSLVVNLKDGAIDPTVPALTGTAFTFTNREISTQLVVNNHHTAILAGVISEKVSDQIHQVPVLHRLPYLGNWLFKNTDRSKEKVELLTFITPYILRSRADVIMATQMTQKKSGAQPLQNLDVVNGDWPEVYADDPKDPFETPPKPPLPPRRR